MKSRRHRVWREETVAPWLSLVVILTLWWAGARLIQRDSAGGAAIRPPSAEPRASDDSPETLTAGDRGTANAPGAPSAPSAPGDIARASSVDDGIGPVVPVAGIEASSLSSTFNEARGGGSRRHEAMDILAPRGTPVLASVSGRVVKLFTSAAGGLTIYQFDEDERYCYYYAHLDSYAPDLTEGQTVSRGQVIGYVGTTGNAPPGTPHLHFAIFRLGPEKKWWEGEPLDPITFLR
jgi:murein DD-endopeptidase MepM/ murein hydrolase activator NlpD